MTPFLTLWWLVCGLRTNYHLIMHAILLKLHSKCMHFVLMLEQQEEGA
jgi:hypothetical protein